MDTERPQVHACTAQHGEDVCGSVALIISTHDGEPWTVACPNGHLWLPMPGSSHTIRACNLLREPRSF